MVRAARWDKSCQSTGHGSWVGAWHPPSRRLQSRRKTGAVFLRILRAGSHTSLRVSAFPLCSLNSASPAPAAWTTEMTVGAHVRHRPRNETRLPSSRWFPIFQLFSSSPHPSRPAPAVGVAPAPPPSLIGCPVGPPSLSLAAQGEVRFPDPNRWPGRGHAPNPGAAVVSGVRWPQCACCGPGASEPGGW